MPHTPPPGDHATPALLPPTRARWLYALMQWRTALVLFYAAIAVAFVSFAGSIVINAIQNHGLVPPPRTLARYDCAGAGTPFMFMYLHGTERVKITSSLGVLEGTVHNNQLDWGGFGNDASQLGFVPPTDINAEDAQALTLQGPGAFTMHCTRAASAKPAA